MVKDNGSVKMPHVLKFGSHGIIYNGELYSFPDKRMREKVYREIAKVERSRSLYAEMDLKARIYRYSKGSI